MSETHGETLTAAEAARQLGISEAAIRKRIKAGTLIIGLSFRPQCRVLFD